MARPAQLYINTSAYEQNLSVIRTMSSQAKMIAVLRGNAYGHGLELTARALKSVEAFAVGTLDEAIFLRNIYPHKIIIMLDGVYDRDGLVSALAIDAQIVLRDSAQIDLLESIYTKNNACVWIDAAICGIQVDGLQEVLVSVYKRIATIPFIKKIGIIADMKDVGSACCVDMNLQLEAYANLRNTLSTEICVCGFASILHASKHSVDWVMPGKALYGVSAALEDNSGLLSLRPVMRFTTRLIAIKEVKKGEEVGYGGAFKANINLQLGIAAVGYGDGYPRHAQSGAPVVVNGKRSKLLGRVSMDMIAIDLSEVGPAKVGDLVELWGESLPIDEVALAAGTIPEELFCRLSKRVSIAIQS